MDAGFDTCGPRLQRLGAADLAPVACDRGVVGHVLRLEGAHLEPARRIGAAQAATSRDLPTLEPVP